MKEYKGLKTPGVMSLVEIGLTEMQKYLNTQRGLCLCCACKGVECSECIYYEDNIDEFIELLKSQEKQEK